MIAAALMFMILAAGGSQQRGTTPAVSADVVRDLAARGEMEAARKVAEQLVRMSPADGEAWYVLGYVRASLQDISGAMEAYRNATRNAPSHADAWNNLGDLLRRTGQLQEARSAIERGRRVNPKDPRLALNLALVEIQLRNFASALRALDDVEAAGGPSTVTDYLRARTHLDSGQVAEAQRYLDRFRAAEPQDAEAFLGLAKLLIAQDAYLQAAELLLALKPERQEPATRFTLGQVFYAVEQMEKARDIFVELAARQPEKAIYLTWSGHAHRALGATAEARSAYERAIRADGSAAEALTELASLELDAGNTAEAQVLASRAISLSPNDSRTQFVAGQVYVRLQRWPDAIQILGKIKREALEYAQAQYMLSRAFRQSGDTARAEAAIAEFKKAAASGSAESPKRKRINPK